MTAEVSRRLPVRVLVAAGVTAVLLALIVVVGLRISPTASGPLIFVESLSARISGLLLLAGAKVPVGYALVAGMVASVNPCGFVLLPAYLAYYLGDGKNGTRGQVRRALLVSVTVTASFRLLYVFVIMQVGTRRIAHFNVTGHPTADWALQQFREVITGDKPYRFLLHDRDRTYSSAFDSALKAMGMTILRTPFRAPRANAFCERLVGSMRRECLDFLIPLNESHLRRILKEWVAHYNKGRPHCNLGPGIPEPSGGIPVLEISGHRIPCGQRVVASAVLAGLHHEYRLEKIAA